jgi:hypothetical protein
MLPKESFMKMRKRRSRIICFRLSPEEYSQFSEMCTDHSVPSISELARTALNRLRVGSGPRTEQISTPVFTAGSNGAIHGGGNNSRPLSEQIRQLQERLRAIADEVDAVAKKVDAGRHIRGNQAALRKAAIS